MSTSHIVLISLLLCLARATTDFYKILEVDQDATESQIRKAFRKLSVQYHPDKNPGDRDATKRFQDLNKAFEVLTDPVKRYIYDMYASPIDQGTASKDCRTPPTCRKTKAQMQRQTSS